MNRLLQTSVALMAACLAAGVAGCGSGASSPNAAFTTGASSALRAVWNSPEGRARGALFPRTPGTRPCVIRGGGPAPGIRVRGRCSTSVEGANNGGTEVRLTERWGADEFYGPGSSGSGELNHSWVFVVAQSGEVLSIREEGAFPPEKVK